MVLAFQADITRISTFMLADEGSGRAYTNLEIKDGHHDISHHGRDAAKLDKLQKINRYHVEQLAYILTKMKNIKEGDKSLLDNTMLVYGAGISDGDRHNHNDLPILLCGKGGGAIKTGRHIKYRRPDPHEQPARHDARPVRRSWRDHRRFVWEARPALLVTNIVVILADDLGYGDLGCYNPASKIPTPHLDGLAREGVRATDAHAPASVCSPTRYAMLTGRYAWRGLLKSGVVAPWGPPILERDRLNAAQLLRNHGYQTACFGKWHLGWSWSTKDGAPPKDVNAGPSNVDFSRPIGDGPTTRGFETYFGVDAPNFPPYCFLEGDRTVGMPNLHTEKVGQINRPGPILPGWRLENILPEVGRRAVAWLERASQNRKPFFLFCR